MDEHNTSFSLPGVLNGQECEQPVALPETKTVGHNHLLAEGRRRS